MADATSGNEPVAPPANAVARLKTARNIWLATVRPDGRPHLVPLWHVWVGGRVYLVTGSKSVKVGNIAVNPQVALTLEDGNHPIICEGVAALLAPPWADVVSEAFAAKYDWAIATETQYTLIAITPQRWLQW